MKVAVVLFTRDLRVHDNPALSTAARAAERVVPLFVHDPAIRAGEPEAARAACAQRAEVMASILLTELVRRGVLRALRSQ